MDYTEGDGKMNKALDFTFRHQLACCYVLLILILTSPFIVAIVLDRSPLKGGTMLAVVTLLLGVVIPWGIAVSTYNSRQQQLNRHINGR